MVYIRVKFDNGDEIITGFNGTLNDAKAYYLNKTFNLGDVHDDMHRCISLEEVM